MNETAVIALIARIKAMRLPPSLEPRRARMMWLLVALYCEMADVADALEPPLHSPFERSTTETSMRGSPRETGSEG